MKKKKKQKKTSHMQKLWGNKKCNKPDEISNQISIDKLQLHKLKENTQTQKKHHGYDNQ